MKTEFADVNATRKTVRVEIPSDVVTSEIDRIAKDYSRKARVPGFRPGKTPPRVIKQRYKDQILHDVAHDLALDHREQGVGGGARRNVGRRDAALLVAADPPRGGAPARAIARSTSVATRPRSSPYRLADIAIMR